MKSENILDAIGAINEEAVREAKAYRRPKSRSWVKWGAVAACLCLVVAGVFTMLPYEDWWEHQADDPNWPKTHLQTSELSEIEVVCGTDLLLDKIALPGEYHSEYILEVVENGDFNNTEDWSNLSVQISYGDSVIDGTADNIYCFISFDGNTGVINIPLWESDTILELNGYSVQYSEKTTEEYVAEGVTLGSELNYHGYAVFTHNGYTYYLATNSDNPDFYDSVIDQMLTDSKPTE